MKEAGEPFDPKAYLPAITGYYSTAKGEMLSFPFNSSRMVMWVNKDALKKAGSTRKSPKTWPEMFDAGKKLKAAGHDKCGFTTGWSPGRTSSSSRPGTTCRSAPRRTASTASTPSSSSTRRCTCAMLTELVELQKDKTYDYSGRTNERRGPLHVGRMRDLLTSSALLRQRQGATRSSTVAAAPMPYYPDVKGAPQNSIIGGASLWVMGGKTPGRVQGRRQVLHLPVRHRPAGDLHEVSGYLPITKAAYEKTKASGFYEKNPGREVPMKELTNKPPTENSRGLRFGNMVQIRDVVGGGDRGRARRQEDAAGGARRRPSRAATRCCASSSARRASEPGP